MSQHIYTTYVLVNGILGLCFEGGWGGGDRVVEAKEDSIQLKTLTSGAKYSISKYIEASTVQIYIRRPLKQKLASDVGKIIPPYTLKVVSLYVLSENVQHPWALFRQITLNFASRERNRLITRNPLIYLQ